MTQIIGLVGRSGSGKTTAAKVIQYITSRAEYAWLVNQSLEDFIEEYGKDDNPCLYAANEGVICAPWRIKSFAHKLKLFASMLTGFPVEKWDDQSFKESYMPTQWGKMTCRQFLQKLGTDGMRDAVHPHIHINGLFADYNTTSHWIIPDVRFRNECDAIKSRGGLVIWIDRKTTKGDLHQSETEMNTFRDLCDAQIDNNGTLEDLRFLLQVFLSQYNILPTIPA